METILGNSEQLSNQTLAFGSDDYRKGKKMKVLHSKRNYKCEKRLCELTPEISNNKTQKNVRRRISFHIISRILAF